MYVQVCQFSVFLGRHIIAHTRKSDYALITNLFGYFLTSTEVLFCNLQLRKKNANMHVLTNVLFAWLFIK